MFHIVLFCFACASSAPVPVDPPATPGVVAGHRQDVDIVALEQALGSGAVLIDVRTPDEWAPAHVPGAVLITAPIAADNPFLVQQAKDQPLYVICESGGRSARASDQLAAQGYEVRNVLGGTRAWRDAGKPVSTP